MLYRCNFEYLKHYRLWDEEVVVYHPPSGSTHRLNILAHDLLRLLDTPKSEEKLTELLTQCYAENTKAELSSAIATTLNFLLESGLLHKQPESTVQSQ